VDVAKIEINKVELVWPGKYNEDGTLKEVPRVNLPFQVIETVNESRASREAAKKPQNLSLFDVYEGKEGDTFEEGWRNKLIWGDNLLMMGSLLEKFAGKIDLIYIDPPFATGADFRFTARIGDEGKQVDKDRSAIEEKAYRDTWGGGIESYLSMMHPRLVLMKDLLASNGSIYIHLDRNMSQSIKLLADEAFAVDHFVNDITWKRSHAHGDTGQGAKHFGRVTESILIYSVGESPIWNSQYIPYSRSIIDRDYKYLDEATGQRYRLMPVDGPGGAAKGNPYYEFLGVKGYWRYSEKTMQELNERGEVLLSSTGKSLSRKRYLKDAKGTPVTDLWDDVNRISPTSSERLEYATQKPESLIQRILEASSNPGDLVADFFCGSGTTCAVAEKLGRRWIGCDLSRWAIHTTRKRILEIEGTKPFEVLNLGKYERKYWMGATFGKKGEEQRTIYEYIAFILKLYGAQPLSGMQHLHGKKGKAMVHVGAVDAPVTIDEVNAAIEECLAVNQSELHLLGWEWEMGMNPYIVQEAKRRGIKLLLLNIPREVMEQQAVDKGDIRFFELAHVEIDIKKGESRKVTVELTDFAFPYADLIPEDVREKITKWSDYVDYWAIDWNFQSDTFMQGWVAYRTRKERKLPLTSDPHTYSGGVVSPSSTTTSPEKPGTYTIMVKVVDIFGNDTSQTFKVTV